jgi:CheY-like chemotaxis protein
MKHTVLVVEDEPDLREMMSEALERSGYTVVAAEDGHQALAQLPQIEHLCLVILDLIMPGMDGWDLFQEVRRRSELDAVPILVYSSVPKRAPHGATRVLEKPMGFDQLLTTVREYCAA